MRFLMRLVFEAGGGKADTPRQLFIRRLGFPPSGRFVKLWGMGFVGVIFLMVALLLIGVGLALGLMVGGMIALLMATGMVTSSLWVGWKSGRPAAAVRAMALQVGAAVGGGVGGILGWAMALNGEETISPGWGWGAGAMAGLGVGIGMAWALITVAGRLLQRRRMAGVINPEVGDRYAGRSPRNER